MAVTQFATDKLHYGHEKNESDMFKYTKSVVENYKSIVLHRIQSSYMWLTYTLFKYQYYYANIYDVYYMIQPIRNKILLKLKLNVQYKIVHILFYSVLQHEYCYKLNNNFPRVCFHTFK